MNKQQIGKNTNFIDSLLHALDGVITVYRDERNMKYHTLLSLIPIALGLYFQVSILEWILLIFCIFFVVLMEFLNSMVENIVDLIVEHHFHPLAKKAKDIAAGAVLLSALFTLIVAALIFLPKLYLLFVS